ncbi:tetratricopeptide repeat protein [Cystobacter ferrugineus]|uniref:tetratricopeptide repeat protein n=1 Tax=Cystobacter ferrugineus TaxID=83449 RepID=UPI001160FD5C|nr:tetratricopeptide repeat protein [Cystobacter ferrugineus]
MTRLYEALEYERALEQIEQAKRMVPGVEASVALVLYEGIILAEMIRMDEANRAFRAALFLRPDAKLPVVVSPKLKKHFESARAEVNREMELMRDMRDAKQRHETAITQWETRPGVQPPPETISSSRSRALLPTIVGGVLLAAGGVSYGLARSELSKLRGDDPRLATYADAQASASRGKTFQTMSLGLAGAGVVGLGVAAGLYLLGGPSQPMALGVSTDGTSAFVHGSWQ